MAFGVGAFKPSQARSRMRGVFYGLVACTHQRHCAYDDQRALFHAMGLWFVALESAFGWNRTQLSLAFSFTRIEGGVLGPVEGYLVDRLGVRRMVLIGLSILGVGFLLMSQVRDTKDIPVLRDLPFELLPDFMRIIEPALMFYLVFIDNGPGAGLERLAHDEHNAEQLVHAAQGEGDGLLQRDRTARRAGADSGYRLGCGPGAEQLRMVDDRDAARNRHAGGSHTLSSSYAIVPKTTG